MNEAVKPYEGGDYYYWPDKEIYPIQPREQMIFKFVLDYCKKRDIKLVLYSGASAFCYDIRMHNAVAKFAEECGVEYMDANYDRDVCFPDVVTRLIDDVRRENFTSGRFYRSE